jgi:hypothetical protein
LTVVLGCEASGKQEHGQAVGELVLGDALDGGALRDAGGQRGVRGQRDEGCEQGRERAPKEVADEHGHGFVKSPA